MDYDEIYDEIKEGKRKLTVEYMKKVKKIIKKVNDNETAHGLEDDLHELFMYFVIGNCTDKKIKEMAIVLKEISDLDFERWYA